MKKVLNATFFAAAVLTLIVIATIALAEKVIWKWVDEKGGIHYVEYLSQVPEKYRSKAVKIVLDNAPESNTAPENKQAPPPPPPVQDNRKAEFKEKARKAIVQLTGIETEKKALEPQCQELDRKAQVVPTLQNKQIAADCRQKLDALNNALSEAAKYLQEDIYKEAADLGVSAESVDEFIQKTKEELGTNKQ